MGNKTIYVSEKDEQLFDKAKTIAGEALSSVIVRALKEYVARNAEKEKGMKEIAVKVGPQEAEREQRFVGSLLGDWRGFSDDKEWWITATLYRTQKGKIAVHLVTVCKASLLIDKKAWKQNGDYLINARSAVLLVGDTSQDFSGKVPTKLYLTLQEQTQRYEVPVEYLDI